MVVIPSGKDFHHSQGTSMSTLIIGNNHKSRISSFTDSWLSQTHTLRFPLFSTWSSRNPGLQKKPQMMKQQAGPIERSKPMSALLAFLIFFNSNSHVAQIYLHRIEITRPQTLIGSFSQMSAGLTHHVTPARLSQISSIPKVAIVTGDQDNLVAPSNSAYLKEHMKEAEYVVFENTGHSVQAQRKERFNELLERVFREGRERVGPAGA